jgi:hypothetical protein
LTQPMAKWGWKADGSFWEKVQPKLTSFRSAVGDTAYL